MASFIFAGVKDAIKENGYATALEPAVGVGGMVIECTNMLKAEGVNFSKDVIWRVVELDYNTFMACYIQLSLAGVNAQVVHGNSLSLEVMKTVNTPVRFLHYRKI